MRVGSCRAGKLEAAFAIKRNGRLIAGRDPYKKVSRAAYLCPVSDLLLTSPNSNTLSAHCAVHEYADHRWL